MFQHSNVRLMTWGKRLDILHEQKQVHPAATCASSIKDIIAFLKKRSYVCLPIQNMFLIETAMKYVLFELVIWSLVHLLL